MIFEWDPKRARLISQSTRSFEEASTVFNDPLSRTFDDPDHSIDEQRFIIIGHSDKNRLLFVCHTDDEKLVRLISARDVTNAERKYHEEK